MILINTIHRQKGTVILKPNQFSDTDASAFANAEASFDPKNQTTIFY